MWNGAVLAGVVYTFLQGSQPHSSQRWKRPVLLRPSSYTPQNSIICNLRPDGTIDLLVWPPVYLRALTPPSTHHPTTKIRPQYYSPQVTTGDFRLTLEKWKPFQFRRHPVKYFRLEWAELYVKNYCYAFSAWTWQQWTLQRNFQLQFLQPAEPLTLGTSTIRRTD